VLAFGCESHELFGRVHGLPLRASCLVQQNLNPPERFPSRHNN
jgi:hypothetical protein